MQESTTYTTEELGDLVMGILVRLLEDQNKKTYQYQRVSEESAKEETA